ncbi:predicted protein [Chaetomium globosum CBS 148.51]|uniref:Uncharacterized protein n=1 Tax=Chaetomium globosum (strain ATCC 6205 / CBS 148.51 / DSM 1962 / NBRC 6347 / NRRL 1970) TaxID=306901 RepID=Q2GQ26_CHAGB|nr:uncharacterized protein CHGG_09928 [Chaetomium globosum CBS 148.51]EAQ83524.1 predicted protein [Chaetomium globosum CBS 148.51]
MRITSSQALHKPCLTPLPTQVRPEAGLLDEDSEKRVLREKLETIEAQSPDQLAKDLKKFSGLFNQNLQAIATDNRIKGASGKLPLMNPSDPFVGKNVTKNTNRVAAFVRPTNAVTTPLRSARRYQPSRIPAIFTLPGLVVPPPPAAPYFHHAPPMPHNPPMGPSGFPPNTGGGGAGGRPVGYPTYNQSNQAPEPGKGLQGLAQRKNGLAIANSFLGPPRGDVPNGACARCNYPNPSRGSNHHPRPSQNGPPVMLPYGPGAGQPRMASKPSLTAHPHATSRPPLPVAQRSQSFRPPIPAPQPGQPAFPRVIPHGPYDPPPPFPPRAIFNPAATGTTAAPTTGPAPPANLIPPPYPVSPFFSRRPAPPPRFAPRETPYPGSTYHPPYPSAVPHAGSYHPSAIPYAPPPYVPYPPPHYAPYAPHPPAPPPAPAVPAAPLLLGPLPGRPAALLWFDAVPGLKSPAWVAVPQQGNGRQKFVPRPVGGGARGLRERGSPLERGRRGRRGGRGVW